MPAPGNILQGRYRIIRELGRGGMGAVYEATDLRLSRTVALKETFATTSEMRRAFEHEARLLANLRYHSLPKVLDHFTEGEGQFLIMEFIPGADLSQMLQQRRRPFPVVQVLRWADEILATLEYLHSHWPPIIHRDIKPSNLKIMANDQIILLDFGLAKGAAGEMTRPTVSRSVSGYTLHYAPLEQMQGEKTGPRSDLYATAATLYHLFTGMMPQDALTRTSAMLSDADDPLPLASQVNPNVPLPVALILARALSLKPAERPASAAEMRSMLNDVVPPAATMVSPGFRLESVMQTIPGKPDLVSDPFAPSTSPSGTTQRGGHFKTGWIFTALLCLALIGGLYILYLSRQTKEGQPPSAMVASMPAKPAIPSPYREALASVVALDMKDAEGKSIGRASGFFINDGEIVTDLAAIGGATQGRATLADQDASFDVAGVSAVDRVRGLAVLKLSGGKAAPLKINDKSPMTAGMKIAVLSTATDRQGLYAEGTISGYRKSDDVIEINAPIDANAKGGALVNERGEAVGVLIESPNQDKGRVAVSIARLLSITKRQQPVSSLAVAGAKEVLYDFRKTAPEEEKKVPPEVERKVLTAVFGSYFTDGSQCGDLAYTTDASTPEGMKEARKAGSIVPSISDSATGSFTEAGAQQTAYLIFVGECGAAHVVNFGTKRLAVFTGDTLVLNIDIQDHTSILGTYDLNRDGVNELLVTGSYAQSGEVGTWAMLFDVSGGRLHVHKKIESASGDDCASMSNTPSSRAAVVYYTRSAGGAMPEFRVDNYQAKCTEELDPPKPSDYRYTSTGKAP